MQPADKETVRRFWDQNPCGETYATGPDLRAQLESHAAARYSMEPYIPSFAGFDRAYGEDVLEVGVGMGADHVRFAQAEPRSLTGVDLSPRAVEWTQNRLDAYGLHSDLHVADAESLPFPDESFTFVYSWGVLLEAPNIYNAIAEVHRVLTPGGQARVMIYNRDSIVAYSLWLRYALFTGRPHVGLRTICARHLESPGTKVFTLEQAREMFSSFRATHIDVQLSFGDLMEGDVGRQHNPKLVKAAKKLWPRNLIQRYLSGHGLYLLIVADK